MASSNGLFKYLPASVTYQCLPLLIYISDAKCISQKVFARINTHFSSGWKLIDWCQGIDYSRGPKFMRLGLRTLNIIVIEWIGNFGVDLVSISRYGLDIAGKAETSVVGFFGYKNFWISTLNITLLERGLSEILRPIGWFKVISAYEIWRYAYWSWKDTWSSLSLGRGSYRGRCWCSEMS